MNKIIVGDKVKVLQGRDRGREGSVVKVWPKKSMAIVEGINIVKKHIKPQATQDGKGGIFDIPKPISVSKLAVVDPNTKRPAKVRFKLEGKKKVRINKKTGKIIGKVK